MLARRTVLVLCIATVASCGDASSPNDEVAGLYALQRVNSLALPTGDACRGFTIVGADLTLSADGQASFTRHLIARDAGAGSVYLVVTGRYLATPEAVLVDGAGHWSNSPSTFHAQLRFGRDGGVLRGGGGGPECDAPPSVEEYERVVGL